MVNPARVALETTLLVHGVPRAAALPLFDELSELVRGVGATPALCGVLHGRLRADLSRDELEQLLEGDVPKLNTSNLGVALFRQRSGATTVSTTVEIAALRGVGVFATGGLGGVHRGYGTDLDVSADLLALARHPVAVVTAGVKSILDVVATREALESLGVPVVGYGTDRFPAFMVRDSAAGVDARFDDLDELAAFVTDETRRTGRGVVVCNPIPEANAIPEAEFERWRRDAEAVAAGQGASGRGLTPAILAALFTVSSGRSLQANLALVRNNTQVAAELAVRGSRGSRR